MADDLTGKIQPGILQMPKLPVAGFFLRLLAIILDLVIVLGGLHLLSRVIPGLFWALGEWSPYITGLLTFLYFALLNGPVGKGRTVGKLLMRIQTTDHDGDPPTFRQSAIRTVVLIPIFVTVPIVKVLFGEATSSMEDYITSMITVFPFVAVIMATCLTIPFNPFKQGVHDFFAKTLVRPAPDKDAEVVTFEEMTERIGLTWPKFHRQPQYSGGVTFAIVFGLLAFMAWPGRGGEDFTEFQRRFYELKAIPVFQHTTISRNPVQEQRFTEAVVYQEFVDNGIIAPIDSPTTGTVHLYVPVTYDGNWPFQPDSREFSDNLNEFSDAYHERIIKFIVQKLGEIPEENRLSWYEDWRQYPIDLHLVFTSAVWLYPYPMPLEKAVGHFNKKYPPIYSEESKAEGEIPLESDGEPDE